MKSEKIKLENEKEESLEINNQLQALYDQNQSIGRMKDEIITKLRDQQSISGYNTGNTVDTEGYEDIGKNE